MVTAVFIATFSSMVSLWAYDNHEALQNVNNVGDFVDLIKSFTPVEDYDYPGDSVAGE